MSQFDTLIRPDTLTFSFNAGFQPTKYKSEVEILYEKQTIDSEEVL